MREFHKYGGFRKKFVSANYMIQELDRNYSGTIEKDEIKALYGN